MTTRNFRVNTGLSVGDIAVVAIYKCSYWS